MRVMQSPQMTLGASSTWLKSSTTFQITFVIVSVLMLAVILAFLVFCIIIYQIKPSTAQAATQPTANSMMMQRDKGSGQDSALVRSGSRAVSLIVGLGHQLNFSAPNGRQNHINASHLNLNREQQMYVANNQNTPLLAAICDPITGRSPIHLIAHQPIMQQHHQINQPASHLQQQLQQQPFESIEENAMSWFSQTNSSTASPSQPRSVDYNNNIRPLLQPSLHQ